MHDVLENVPEKTIKCLDKGFVRIVDVLPRLVPEDQKTADYAVAEMARVSYASGTKSVNDDIGLIKYLLRHFHTSPFEGIVLKFHFKLPIFCARQIIRHRTSSVNEASGRYSILKDEFFFPEFVHQQSKTNKQGGDELVPKDVSEEFVESLEKLSNEAYATYEKFLEQGFSREQARMMLPINIYTEWYWQCNLHNLFHFLALRCDAHTQYETRVFADAILKLITPIVPVCVEAWNDYHPMRNALKLTRLEVEALQKSLSGLKAVSLESSNKREQAEWMEKAKRLGMICE